MTKKPDIKGLKKISKEIRIEIVKMLNCSGSGHTGGSLSMVELLVGLYFYKFRCEPTKPLCNTRDIFVLSKGHGCPALYATLAYMNFFGKEELCTLRKLGTRLQGHPQRGLPGVEISSGSLGQGLSVSVGMSLAAKIDKKDYRVYCLMGDGEIQEGNIWEAAMSASHYKCDNLCGILDFNGFQIDGKVKDIMNLEPIVDKWEAFGWQVIEIDGHNMRQILAAYDEAREIKGKPSIIIAHTIKGKGVSFMENVVDFHGRAPTKAETEIALKELE